MKRFSGKEPAAAPVAVASAALFFALPPYELAAHWYEVPLLALTVLPACGMTLLLCCFGRPGLTLFRRCLPAAAGVAALCCTYVVVLKTGTAGSVALAAFAPLGIALTVMPGVYFLIYRVETAVSLWRIRRKCSSTH